MKVKRIEESKSFPWWFLLVLAVAVSNFRLAGIYMLLAISLLFGIVYYDRIKIPMTAVPLMLFACTYFLFAMPYAGIVSAAKIFVCPLVWLMGYNALEARKMNTIFRVAMVLALGMVFHGLLNYLHNVISGTSFNTGRTYDIWSGTISAATAQAINFTLFLSILPWLLLVGDGHKTKYTSLLLLGAAILYGIQIGSRTFLVLCGIAVAFCVLIYLNKKEYKKNGIGVTIGIIVCVVGLTISYGKNYFGLRTLIENSYLSYRMDWDRQSFFALFQNERFQLKLTYLKNLLEYPWGGRKMSSFAGNYAHDLWLDIFNEVGIIPMIGITLYTVLALLRLSKVRKDRRLSSKERIAITCYSLIIYAQFFVEPIWQGAPLLLCSFMIIDGMLAKFLVTRTDKWT